MAHIAELEQYRQRRERNGESRGPQLEDGHVQIANELYEAIILSPLTLREMRVVMAVIRLTYGWNRKQARVTSGLLAKLTGLHSSRVAKVLSGLIEKRVILRHGGSRSPISINKHYTEWLLDAGKHAPPAAKTERAESAQNEQSESAQNEPPSKDRKDINPLTTFEGGACAPKPAPKPKAKAKGYPEEFEACWKEYPKREGSNPKPKAFSGWKARLKEGVTQEEMLAGVKRYAAYVRAKGDEHTAFVMQAQRFFGTAREFENAWGKPAPKRNEPVDPYANAGDCDGSLYIPAPPADAGSWRRGQ